jgi:hypothetical protein
MAPLFDEPLTLPFSMASALCNTIEVWGFFFIEIARIAFFPRWMNQEYLDQNVMNLGESFVL